MVKDMPDEIKILTRDTLIPIGLALSLLAGVFYMGALSAQIKQNTASISELKTQMQSSPTNFQFSTLQEDISEIKGDIKELKAKY